MIDPTELPGDLAPIDVVLFLGAFYRMHDPIAVLRASVALAREALVIETHQDLLDLPRPGMAFYPRATLNGDESNWWGPNPESVFELLESIGWPQVYYQHASGRRRDPRHLPCVPLRRIRAAHVPRRPGVLDLRTPGGQAAAFSRPADATATRSASGGTGRGFLRRWLR